VSAAAAFPALLGLAAAAASWFAWQFSRGWSLQQTARARVLAQQDLAASFVFVDPERVARVSAWLLAMLPLLAIAVDAPGAVLAVALLLWMLAPRVLGRAVRRARVRMLDAQLPAAADSLAAQLRAGLGLGQALGALATHQPAPLSQEVAFLLRRHRLGLTLDAALEEWPQRASSADLVLFVSALRVSRDLGSGLAEALERLGDTLRRRHMIEDRLRALTAQGRIQGIVVSLLPIALLAVLAWLEPAATQQFFTTREGLAALGLILALEIVGWWLIRRIVNIDV
jgi:tight adherence protein B